MLRGWGLRPSPFSKGSIKIPKSNKKGEFMLPKETVPEGSRMVLNGKEFWTIHNFTTEIGNVLETTGGDFIYPNGEPVRDRSLLNLLPDQHKERALAWWNQRFGATVEIPEKETQPNVVDLMAENEALKAQIAAMSVDTQPEPFEPEKDLKAKEIKRFPGKSKVEKGPGVLEQMGING
jgi:hypothetical protein